MFYLKGTLKYSSYYNSLKITFIISILCIYVYIFFIQHTNYLTEVMMYGLEILEETHIPEVMFLYYLTTLRFGISRNYLSYSIYYIILLIGLLSLQGMKILFRFLSFLEVYIFSIEKDQTSFKNKQYFVIIQIQQLHFSGI